MCRTITGSLLAACTATVLLSGPAHGFASHGGMGGGHGKPSATVPEVNGRDVLSRIRVVVETPRSSPFLGNVDIPQQESKSFIGRLLGSKEVRIEAGLMETRYRYLPLATVAGEAVVLQDLTDGLIEAAGAGLEIAPAEGLDRIIGSRLLAAEGREMGMTELPEVKAQMNMHRRQTLRRHLIDQVASGIEPTEADIELLYQDLVRESRIRAAIFEDETAAKKFADAVNDRAGFSQKAQAAVDKGAATLKGGTEGEFVRHSNLMREIVDALNAMEAGEVSSPIPTDDGFMVVCLEEKRHKEDPSARETAIVRARNFVRNKALIELNRTLIDKYVQIDNELLQSLDFDGKVDKLLDDQRRIATVENGPDVTVARFARAVKMRYFHGLGRAIKTGRLEKDKEKILREMVFKEVFVAEALTRGIDQTPAFKRELANRERSFIFGAFVERVLVPESKLSIAEIETYFDNHRQEYATPPMVAMQSLAFANAEAAGAALAQLQKGTDFDWLKTNAPNQLPESEEIVHFHGALLIYESLTPGVQRAIKGAVQGNARLFVDSEGNHHVLLIERVIPGQIQAFEQVRDEVTKKAFDEKLEKALTSWREKLREVYQVETYVKEFLSSDK